MYSSKHHVTMIEMCLMSATQSIAYGAKDLNDVIDRAEKCRNRNFMSIKCY